MAPLSKADGPQTDPKSLEAVGALMCHNDTAWLVIRRSLPRKIQRQSQTRALEGSCKGTSLPQANGGHRGHAPKKQSNRYEAIGVI